MKHHRVEGLLVRFAVAALALMAAGCSLSSSPVTGSLFGGGSQAPAPPPPTNTPELRTRQVATVSAQARKCGFNFNADQLKARFLAAEQQAGTTADQLQGLERAYDDRLRKVTLVLATDEDYCGGETTRTIKSDLTRHLAGDFSPPAAARPSGISDAELAKHMTSGQAKTSGVPKAFEGHRN